MLHIQQQSAELTRELLTKKCDNCAHHMGAHRIVGAGGLQPFQVIECLAELCTCSNFENPEVEEYPGVENTRKKGGKPRR